MSEVNSSGEKQLKAVEYSHFCFKPYHEEGTHAGEIILCAKKSRKEIIYTSKVLKIYQYKGSYVVETLNTRYKLKHGTRPAHLAQILKYLREENYSSKSLQSCAITQEQDEYGFMIL